MSQGQRNNMESMQSVIAALQAAKTALKADCRSHESNWHAWTAEEKRLHAENEKLREYEAYYLNETRHCRRWRQKSQVANRQLAALRASEAEAVELLKRSREQYCDMAFEESREAFLSKRKEGGE